MNSDDAPKKNAHPLLTVSGLLGGVIGFYCGIMLFIPFAGAMIALFLAKHFAPATLKPFTAALAVIFGHAVWMLVGGLLTHSIAPVIADVLIIAAGLLWLVLRPGLGAVILLCIYEVVCLVVNGVEIMPLDFGTPMHKALSAHIALRLFAVGALIAGCRQFRKEQAELADEAAQ